MDERFMADMDRAVDTCRRIYGTCLKIFRKVGPHNYHAICGIK